MPSLLTLKAKISQTILSSALPCIAIGGAVILTGCQTTPVAAWEKGVLAEPVMSPSGLVQYSAINTHVYTSKETARGGDGVAGGGCGCN